MNWENIEERGRFIKATTAMCEVFGKDMSEPGIKLYNFALQDLAIDDVVRAMGKACGTMKFFPKPVEIREMIQGPIDDIAQIEAAKVKEAVERHGRYKSVVFDDPVTQAVIEQYGGWIGIGEQIDEQGLQWFIKNFSKAYAAFARQGIKRFGLMAGVHDTDNAAKGFDKHISTPILIGDTAKAQAVLEGTDQNKALDAQEQTRLKLLMLKAIGSGDDDNGNDPIDV